MPNIKKLEKIALVVFALLCALLLLSLFVSPEKKYREKTVETALFSRDNVSSVTRILLEDSSFSLAIEKEDDDYFALLPSGEKLIAENEFVTSFLKNISTTRDALLVSEKKSNWSETGVDGNGSFSLSIEYGEGKNATIFFGNGFSGGGKVFFRAASSPFVYECDNDFSAYLKTDLSLWASKSLIATLGNVNDGDLQVLSFGEKVLSGEKLKDKERTILSLNRGLVIAHIPDAAEEKLRLVVEFLGERETRLTFFFKDSLYFVRSDIFVRGEKKASYCFEVSEWTFDNLSAIFS